jgi:DNA-binding XRE family transcriptional regulator
MRRFEGNLLWQIGFVHGDSPARQAVYTQAQCRTDLEELIALMKRIPVRTARPKKLPAFARLLKEARRLHCHKQKQAADEIGAKQEEISQWERDERSPVPEKYAKCVAYMENVGLHLPSK